MIDNGFWFRSDLILFRLFFYILPILYCIYSPPITQASNGYIALLRIFEEFNSRFVAIASYWRLSKLLVVVTHYGGCEGWSLSWLCTHNARLGSLIVCINHRSPSASTEPPLSSRQVCPTRLTMSTLSQHSSLPFPHPPSMARLIMKNRERSHNLSPRSTPPYEICCATTVNSLPGGCWNYSKQWHIDIHLQITILKWDCQNMQGNRKKSVTLTLSMVKSLDC